MQVVQLTVPRRDRSHDGIIHPRLPELFCQHTLPLFKQETVDIKHMSANILLDGQPVVKLIPQSRKSAQNCIRFDAFLNPEIRKPLDNILEGHLTDFQKA